MSQNFRAINIRSSTEPVFYQTMRIISFIFVLFFYSNAQAKVEWNFESVDTKASEERSTGVSSENQINDTSHKLNKEPSFAVLSEKKLRNEEQVTNQKKSVTEPVFETQVTRQKNQPIKRDDNLNDSKLEQDDLFPINSDILSLVNDLPEVSEARSNINLSDFEIAKIQSELGPRLKLSTSGGYKLLSNLDRDHRRYSDDDVFLDTNLGLDYTIFDSGLSAAKIDAEEIRQRSKILNLNSIVREQYAELIKVGFKVLEANQIVEKLNTSIERIKTRREIERKRYLSGTGTNTNIKELDLIAIDLINQKQLSLHKIELNTANFENKFKVKIDDYLTIISNTYSNLTENIFEIEIEKLDAIRLFDFELLALESDIKSRQLINRPSINLNVTSNFYDFQDGVSNYEVNGGINLNFPFFDSGFVKSEISVLSSRISMVKDRKRTKTQKLGQELERVSNSLNDTKQQVQASELKMDNLRDKLHQLELRANNLEVSGMDIAKTMNAIDELERTLISSHWAEKTLLVEEASISEKF